MHPKGILALSLLVAIASAVPVSAQRPLVARNAVWKYLDTGMEAPAGWREPAFDDGRWKQGPAPLGYDFGGLGTTVGFGPNDKAKFITTFLRHSFTVGDPSSIRSLRVRLNRDDGAIIYMNGVELWRSNMPAGPVDHRTTALAPSTAVLERVFDTKFLRAGTNVLAVEIHQDRQASSDIVLGFEVEGLTTPAPADPIWGGAPSHVADTLIAAGSTWRYLDNGSDPGDAWKRAEYADASWATGVAPLGYGGDTEATALSFGPDAGNKFTTTYFRRAFTVTNPATLTGLSARLLRDDGAIVYVNGVELWRNNMPAGPAGATTLATANAASTATGEDGWLDTTFSSGVLRPGRNVIAVEIHQSSGGSSDIAMDFSLVGQTNRRFAGTVATPRATLERIYDRLSPDAKVLAGDYLGSATPVARQTISLMLVSPIATGSRSLVERDSVAWQFLRAITEHDPSAQVKKAIVTALGYSTLSPAMKSVFLANVIRAEARPAVVGAAVSTLVRQPIFPGSGTVILEGLKKAGRPAPTDGPFVVWEGDSVAVVTTICEGVVSRARVRPSRGQLQLPTSCAGPRNPGLTLPVRPVAEPSAFTGVGRVYAVSGFRGDYSRALRLLKSGGVIDSAGRWSFGAGHLVIAGDAVLRSAGAGPTPEQNGTMGMLWLIRRLETEAAAQGGAVHYLFGRAELDRFFGVVRNYTNSGYALMGDYRFLEDNAHIAAHVTGIPLTEHLGPDAELGRWIRTRRLMVRIDSTLFSPAGLSPHIAATFTLDSLNAAFRAGMRDPLRQLTDRDIREIFDVFTPGSLSWGGSPGVPVRPVGPIAYSGYVESINGPGNDPHVERKLEYSLREVLARYGAASIVIGTPYVPELTSMHDGMVIAIDRTYDPAGRIEGLLVEGGQRYAIDVAGTRRRIR